MLGYRTLLSSCRTVTKSICSPGWWPISIHAIIQLKIFFIVLRNQECSSRVRTCGCPAQNSQFLTASVTFCCSLTPIADLWAGLAHQAQPSWEAARGRTCSDILWPPSSGWALGFLAQAIYGTLPLQTLSLLWDVSLLSPCALVPSPLLGSHGNTQEEEWKRPWITHWTHFPFSFLSSVNVHFSWAGVESLWKRHLNAANNAAGDAAGDDAAAGNAADDAGDDAAAPQLQGQFPRAFWIRFHLSCLIPEDSTEWCSWTQQFENGKLFWGGIPVSGCLHSPWPR